MRKIIIALSLAAAFGGHRPRFREMQRRHGRLEAARDAADQARRRRLESPFVQDRRRLLRGLCHQCRRQTLQSVEIKIRACTRWRAMPALASSSARPRARFSMPAICCATGTPLSQPQPARGRNGRYTASDGRWHRAHWLDADHGCLLGDRMGRRNVETLDCNRTACGWRCPCEPPAP